MNPFFFHGVFMNELEGDGEDFLAIQSSACGGIILGARYRGKQTLRDEEANRQDRSKGWVILIFKDSLTRSNDYPPSLFFQADEWVLRLAK